MTDIGNGWKPWDGRAVGPDLGQEKTVDVKFRDGSVNVECSKYELDWEHDENRPNAAIIAYRLSSLKNTPKRITTLGGAPVTVFQAPGSNAIYTKMGGLQTPRMDVENTRELALELLALCQKEVVTFDEKRFDKHLELLAGVEGDVQNFEAKINAMCWGVAPNHPDYKFAKNLEDDAANLMIGFMVIKAEFELILETITGKSIDKIPF